MTLVLPVFFCAVLEKLDTLLLKAAHRFIDFIPKPEMVILVCERYGERLKAGLWSG
ncbi:MAG: hypothetical protein JEZ12_02875 [Desulfobacterium sp.]|nr:hypothetical protein [Desulfobacterium sp.]